MTKPIEQLSAQELYELAKEREQQELEKEREEAKAQVDDLRAQKRELIAEHRKQVAALDREIRKLRGRSAGGPRPGRRGGRGEVAERVSQIVQAHGPIKTKDIRAKLEEQGVEAANLSQTLSYLKRTGRVSSPERSVYAPA